MKYFLLVIAASVVATATPVAVPEIDPSSAASATTLLAGGLVVLRSFLKK